VSTKSTVVSLKVVITFVEKEEPEVEEETVEE